jgi:hypothetical protein
MAPLKTLFLMIHPTPPSERPPDWTGRPSNQAEREESGIFRGAHN